METGTNTLIITNPNNRKACQLLAKCNLGAEIPLGRSLYPVIIGEIKLSCLKNR